jgi:uncharacterized membrane protein YcaP (DUF421 family)
LFDYIIVFRLPEIHDEPICSARATVITFIIVVLIIIVAAIAIGIVLGIINTSQKATENVNKFSCLFIFFYVSKIKILKRKFSLF